VVAGRERGLYNPPDRDGRPIIGHAPAPAAWLHLAGGRAGGPQGAAMPPSPHRDEPEYRTRRTRIDPQLIAQGWAIVPFHAATAPALYTHHAVTEYPTANGPADYALFVAGQSLGIIEAKKLTLGPQNVLTQAERYARGLTDSPFDFGGCRAPFLYSTNGEAVWFHDVRHPLNRSHRLAAFHTPAALAEMIGRDFDAACSRLVATPNNHPLLRPYQVEANTSIEQAVAGRKRQMLVAMATGTGKTFTLVNQVYRLMKSGAARRILFLVDRRALAAQAVNAFASFEPEPGLKFDKIYEVYSQRFRREDLGDDTKFDAKVIPDGYLRDPRPGHAFVYVCTIQRMAINLFGWQAAFEAGDDLPLPPLAEQKRIVAKVEALLARVNAARQRLAKVPAILKRFRQSVLAAACSGRLTADWRVEHTDLESVRLRIERVRNELGPAKTRRDVPDAVDLPDCLGDMALPDTWSLISAAELLRSGILVDVKDGNHGSNHPKVADFTAEGLPFITATQVRDFTIDYESAYRVSGEHLKKLRVGFAKCGDAILTHKGSVGRSALNTCECVLTPQTTYYRCNEGALSARYLVYYFASPQFYSQLAGVMSQTTRDFVPISEQYRLFIILPSPAEQHEIVRRVEALFRLADAIEKRVAAATARAEKLTQAVLAKAFRGELVPTEAELARREGRSYEPASVLLDRIRAERAAVPAPRKRPARHPKP
jgi:hypothetical protein